MSSLILQNVLLTLLRWCKRLVRWVRRWRTPRRSRSLERTAQNSCFFFCMVFHVPPNRFADEISPRDDGPIMSIGSITPTVWTLIRRLKNVRDLNVKNNLYYYNFFFYEKTYYDLKYTFDSKIPAVSSGRNEANWSTTI